jgi:MFS family permease
VALLAVLRMLPYIVLGYLMGALADAINRKHLLVASLIAMVATSTIMVALTAAGAATYAAIAAAGMASGAFWTTDMPVRRRLLVDAVDGGRVAAALGFDNSTMYATRALGPAHGGATYQFLGISGIYALIAASFVICLWLALRIDASREHPPAITPAWASLRLLLPPRDLMQDRRLQIIMGVTLVYNLWCFPFVTMVPVIASRDFALTPMLVGALSACDGLGDTIGGMAVHRVDGPGDGAGVGAAPVGSTSRFDRRLRCFAGVLPPFLCLAP